MPARTNRRGAALALAFTGTLAAAAFAASSWHARAESPAARITRGPIVSFDAQGPTITVTIADATSRCHVVARWPGANGAVSRDLALSSRGKSTAALGEVPPSTAVDYEIFDGPVSLGHHALKTLPAAGTPFVFAALGDSGEAPGQTKTAGEPQLRVARALEQEQPALVLHTGDVIYPAGQASGLDPLFFEPYAATLARVPLLCCLGNHDLRTEDGHPELESFPHPPNENADRFYSFDAGDVHFLVLDSNEALDPTKFSQTKQARWLKADLAASRAAWKVAVFHHPIHSAPIVRIWEIEAVRASFEDLLHEGGVDLVLCGHDHFYHRTFRVLHGARDDKGIVNVVTGGGGAALYPATKGDETAAFATKFHYVRVHVDATKLTLEAVAPAASGAPEIFDTVTLSHGKVWR